METVETPGRRFAPDSVPVVIQAKVYYAADVQAMGGIVAFMKSIGADKDRQLPEIDFTEDEWNQMLNEESK